MSTPQHPAGPVGEEPFPASPEPLPTTPEPVPATPEDEELIEEFDLDDIEVIESKVFG